MIVVTINRITEMDKNSDTLSDYAQDKKPWARVTHSVGAGFGERLLPSLNIVG